MPNSKQIVYLSQAQYAELITNGAITVNGVTVTYDENDIYVTPQAEPVTDVQINGTSIAANGVANIPMATATTAGAVIVGDGLQKGSTKLLTNPATAAQIKAGIKPYEPIVPSTQNYSVFYGLAKAAGHDEKDSTESLGTYTPEAKGAIQQMLGVSDLIAPAENDLVASQAYAVGDIFTANGKLYKVTTAIAADEAIVLQNDGETVSGANAVQCKLGEETIKDIQVNGVSVLQDGVANVPEAGINKFGVCRVHPDYGITILAHTLYINSASEAQTKAGTDNNRPITSARQHLSAFYGLAKAAGDTTQSASSNAVGTYTDNAKASIKAMLGIQDGSTGTVDITGTTPTITAVENTRYVCGEVTSLNFTPAASGICIVRFTSGSTVTVLTLPSTVKFPEWFDSTSLETNTIYEICITDGIYGAVMSWAL